jgi:Protein of unknown function (DUF1552)
MSRLALNRRRFLQAIGASALTYPFLRALPSYAAGNAGATNIVLLFTSCGVVRYKWGAQGPAATATTNAVTSPLVFRDTLSAFTKAAPLTATGVPSGATRDLTSKVIVLDGLSVKAAQGSHEAGMAALWTGLTATGSAVTGGASIDQQIAAAFSSAGTGASYPTVPLMVRGHDDLSDNSVQTRMLYSPGGTSFVPPYDDPVKALGAFFPGVPTMGGATGPDKTTFIRQQAMAQLNKDLSSVQSRLCTEDRQKLSDLQDAWNALSTQMQNAAMAAQSCVPPSAAPAGYNFLADPSLFPQNAQLQMNILAMALACGLTRVGSLQFSTALSSLTHSWIDSTQTQTHHTYSHMGPTYLGALGPDLYNEPSSTTSQYPPQLIAIDAWYAQQVATFAATLDSHGVLDQTVICWGSELDMGAAHNHDDTPFVLIGGAGEKLKTNQLVRFPVNLNNMTGATTRAHNDLLITLAHVMGVEMSTFGTAQYCSAQPLITEILA